MTAFLAFGPGADAGEALPTQDFHFSFNATLADGSISGGGAPMTQEQSPTVWLVNEATGSLSLCPRPMYLERGLRAPQELQPKLASRERSPESRFSNNDNLLLISGAAEQLTMGGVSLAVDDSFGRLNIADGS